MNSIGYHDNGTCVSVVPVLQMKVSVSFHNSTSARTCMCTTFFDSNKENAVL